MKSNNNNDVIYSQLSDFSYSEQSQSELPNVIRKQLSPPPINKQLSFGQLPNSRKSTKIEKQNFNSTIKRRNSRARLDKVSFADDYFQRTLLTMDGQNDFNFDDDTDGAIQNSPTNFTEKYDSNVEQEVSLFKNLIESRRGLFSCTGDMSTASQKAKLIKDAKRTSSATKRLQLLQRTQVSQICHVSDILTNNFAVDNYIVKTDAYKLLPVLQKKIPSSDSEIISSPFDGSQWEYETKSNSHNKTINTATATTLNGNTNDTLITKLPLHDYGDSPADTPLSSSPIPHEKRQDEFEHSPLLASLLQPVPYMDQSSKNNSSNHNPIALDSTGRRSSVRFESISDRPSSSAPGTNVQISNASSNSNSSSSSDISLEKLPGGVLAKILEESNGHSLDRNRDRSTMSALKKENKERRTPTADRDRVLEEDDIDIGSFLPPDDADVADDAAADNRSFREDSPLQENNYFGQSARNRFFSLYQRLATSSTGKTPPSSLKPRDVTSAPPSRQSRVQSTVGKKRIVKRPASSGSMSRPMLATAPATPTATPLDSMPILLPTGISRQDSRNYQFIMTMSASQTSKPLGGPPDGSGVMHGDHDTSDVSRDSHFLPSAATSSLWTPEAANGSSGVRASGTGIQRPSSDVNRTLSAGNGLLEYNRKEKDRPGGRDLSPLSYAARGFGGGVTRSGSPGRDRRKASMSSLDTNFRVDGTGSDNDILEVLSSPRHRFLLRLIQDSQLTPLPIIIRQLRGSVELNLAHRSLRDEYLICLSEVLSDLPELSKLNIRDNCLTERGMSSVVKALALQTHLIEVDLSLNEVDRKSVELLSSYLKRTDCPLKVLGLSKVGIADDGMTKLMDSIQNNKSLQKLDLSHNMLGGISELTVRSKKSSDIGGTSISRALENNRALTDLDLSWNKLGSMSICYIGRSLHANQTLVHLSLAYNSVKDEGAEILGFSLTDNYSIASLDLSFTGIGANGCMVISTGLRLNSSLSYLNMSGNPIGEDGGRFLLQSLNYYSGQREILLHSCSLEVPERPQKSLSDLFYPTGHYVLDLSKATDRCIASELLRIASVKRGCKFKNLTHQLPNRGEGRFPKVPLNLLRPGNPAAVMGQPYGRWPAEAPRPRHPYTLMTADDWEKCVDKLQLMEEKFGRQWQLPQNGTLVFDFVCPPRSATPINVLNATGMKRLVQSLVMESYQLEDLLVLLGGEQSNRTLVVELISSLLICVRDTSNTEALLRRYLHRTEDLKEVQKSLRAMYYISVNAFSGCYKLEMSLPLDRLAALRLAEISAEENMYIKRTMPSWQKRDHGFTSQKSNRTNFRNEVFRLVPVEKGISDPFFMYGLVDKAPGMLEFDFVSITRPVKRISINDLSENLNVTLVTRGLRPSWSTMKRVISAHINAYSSPLYLLAASLLQSTNKSLQQQQQQQLPVSLPFKLQIGGGGGGGGGELSQPVSRRNSSQLNSAREGGVEGKGKKPTVSHPGPSQSLTSVSQRRSASNTLASRSGYDKSEVEDSLDSASGSPRMDFVELPLEPWLDSNCTVGCWLTKLNVSSLQELRDRLEAIGAHHLRMLKPEDVRAMYRDLETDTAAYFVNEEIHRFVARLSLKLVVNVNVANGASNQQYSPNSNQAASVGVGVGAAYNNNSNATSATAAASSAGGSVQNKDSIGSGNNSLCSPLPLQSPALLTQEPSCLEALSVYRMLEDGKIRTSGMPSTESSKDSRFDTVKHLAKSIRVSLTKTTTGNTHASSMLSSLMGAVANHAIGAGTSTPGGTVAEAMRGMDKESDSLLKKYRTGMATNHLTSAAPTSSNALPVSSSVAPPSSILGSSVGSSVTPTHSKYLLSDNMMIIGTDIYMKLPCSFWNDSSVVDYSLHTITQLDEFSANRSDSEIINHVTVSQLEFEVGGLPLYEHHSTLHTPYDVPETDTVNQGDDVPDVATTTPTTNTITTNSSSNNRLNIIWRLKKKKSDKQGAGAPNALVAPSPMSCPPEYWHNRLHLLRVAVSSIWLSADQAATLATEFPVFGMPDNIPYRENAIVSLFSRIIDLERFDVVANTLPQESRFRLFGRIGWLNGISCMKFDGLYNLKLNFEDNRIIAMMLTEFAIKEPGNNFQNPAFRRTIKSGFIAGWELPASWDAATYKGTASPGVPREGQLIVTFSSRPETNTIINFRVRNKWQEKHLLLAVPRCDGSDLHLNDTSPADYDDILY